MFKVNNGNIRTTYKICWKLTIKTPERCQRRRSGVFIVYIVSLLFTFNDSKNVITHWVNNTCWKLKVKLAMTLNRYFPYGDPYNVWCPQNGQTHIKNIARFNAIVDSKCYRIKFKTNNNSYSRIRYISYLRFHHCMKSVQIRCFFWCAFSCIRTEYLRNQSEYKKIQTRKNSLYGQFSHSACI